MVFYNTLFPNASVCIGVTSVRFEKGIYATENPTEIEGLKAAGFEYLKQEVPLADEAVVTTPTVKARAKKG